MRRPKKISFDETIIITGIYFPFSSLEEQLSTNFSKLAGYNNAPV